MTAHLRARRCSAPPRRKHGRKGNTDMMQEADGHLRQQADAGAVATEAGALPGVVRCGVPRSLPARRCQAC